MIPCNYRTSSGRKKRLKVRDEGGKTEQQKHGKEGGCKKGENMKEKGRTHGIPVNEGRKQR